MIFVCFNLSSTHPAFKDDSGEDGVVGQSRNVDAAAGFVQEVAAAAGALQDLAG